MARLQQKTQAADTTGSAETSRPSLRDGVTIYTRSSRGPALLPPSPANSSFAGLASAPGCQNHATSPSHRIVRPHEDHAATRRAHRIPHPTSVTIAKRPLVGTG